MRRALIALALAGLTLPMAACGGSHPLAHAELVSRSDAICDDAAHRIAALPTPRTLPEAVVFAEAGAKVFAEELKALHKLKPSDEDAPTMDRFLAGLQASFEAMTTAADAARSSDRVQLAQALRDGRDGSRSAAATALLLGMTVCGRNVAFDDVG